MNERALALAEKLRALGQQAFGEESSFYQNRVLKQSYVRTGKMIGQWGNLKDSMGQAAGKPNCVFPDTWDWATYQVRIFIQVQQLR